jgi:cryptochrome
MYDVYVDSYFPLAILWRSDVSNPVQGLRLHDNHALKVASKDARVLFPVFCLDPWFITEGKIGPNRLRFLLESLQDVHEGLSGLGSRLILLYGDPKEVIPSAAKAWGVNHVVWEKDVEPYALERDEAVASALKGAGCKVNVPVAQFLELVSVPVSSGLPDCVSLVCIV